MNIKNEEVICIDNTGEENYLTIGKIYLVIAYSPHMKRNSGGASLLREADDGKSITFEANRFISLAKWREQQIKSVIDD